MEDLPVDIGLVKIIIYICLRTSVEDGVEFMDMCWQAPTTTSLAPALDLVALCTDSPPSPEKNVRSRDRWSELLQVSLSNKYALAFAVASLPAQIVHFNPIPPQALPLFSTRKHSNPLVPTTLQSLSKWRHQSDERGFRITPRIA